LTRCIDVRRLQRPRHARAVAVESLRRHAHTSSGSSDRPHGHGFIAATTVHRAAPAARDTTHLAIVERLAQCFGRRPRELGQLVQEEHAAMNPSTGISPKWPPRPAVAGVAGLGEDVAMEEGIRYVRNGGVAIAYQVVGEGEVDLVYVPDYMSNLVYGWESPHWRAFYERLARSFRLILFDKRGTGLSDHGSQFATLETRMEDLRAVLDAAGASNAVVLGASEGCGMAALYAATYPERTRALALFHPVVRGPGLAERVIQEQLSDLRERWGTQEFADEMLRETCPSLYSSEQNRRWFANWLRVGATPAVAYALNRAFFETDLGDVLSAVRVPTLVLYRSIPEDTALALDVAARIPSARAMRVSGNDYWGLFLSLDIVDELERFVAGEKAPFVPDSVLTTVMFTDLVASTGRATELGDRAWRDLLTQHHALVRRELGRFRGEERDTAGDGFFATFDGPARAVRAGQAIIAGLDRLGLHARIGIHTGECELHEGKVSGVAVNVGARIAATASAGEVMVSTTVRDLVSGSGLIFEDRGQRQLKGIPGTWQLYAASPEAPGAGSRS
jgi:class 3 adenylate cyclase/pimeloyl-ACP methyl ester carboxylesterase